MVAEPADEPSRVFLGVSYAVLFIGGVVLGVFGALLLPYSASSAEGTPEPTGGAPAAAHVLASSSSGGIGQLLSVGLLFALLVNPLLSYAGLRTAGTRLAAFTPLIGWLVVVLPMSLGTAEGDVILPSSSRSIAYLLLGTLAFTGMAVIGRPSRGMGALGALPPTPPPTRSAKPVAKRTAPKAPKRR